MSHHHKPKTTSVQFLGAAGTVTGSRFIVSHGNHKVLIDCGLFQGYKYLREKNWQPFPIDPKEIDAVFLTHAHLDHSGYLPVLVKKGFAGNIWCTKATRDLCEILLLDSAKLQEEEANFNNRHKTTKHKPALPLYSTSEAVATLKQFQTVDNHELIEFGVFKAEFHHNGHILGSSFIDLQVAGKHILFTGDMGRPKDPMMLPPEPPVYCDYLVCESTYGNRTHEKTDVYECLAKTINDTVQHGGSILIPSFAVGRAQVLLHILQTMKMENKIPNLPIYLDSPMAIKATELLPRHMESHRLNKTQTKRLFSEITFLRTVEDSMTLNDLNMPAIIISASGMATGGRVLHHLKRMLGDHRNAVIFAGYQSGGTRGDRLVKGEKRIKIHGQFFEVRASIHSLDFLSAHADRVEMLAWLKQMPAAPKNTFIVHGEPESSDALRIELAEQLGWHSRMPEMGEKIEI